MNYYDLIKRLFTEDEFQLLLRDELHTTDDVDLNPGSGFHYRERKHYHVEEKEE